MELISTLNKYLNFIYEYYSEYNKEKVVIGTVEYFDGTNITLNLENNPKLNVSDIVSIDKKDLVVDHYRDGKYHFKTIDDIDLTPGSRVEVVINNSLLFLIENLIENIKTLDKSKIEIINKIYSNEKIDISSNEIKNKTVIERFTKSQNEFIKKAKQLIDESESGFLIVEGPGGTGKTECIAEICNNYLTTNKKILVSGTTNISIDNILNKIESDSILRIGNEISITDDSLKKYSIKNKTKNKDLKSVIRDSKIIASTLDSIHIHLKKQKFDVAIIDEASMSEISKILIPYSVTDKLIICGDRNQLSGFIETKLLERLSNNFTSKEIDLITKSGFKVFSEYFEKYNSTVYLNENFRNPKKIFDFINKNFYENRMVNLVESKTNYTRAKKFGEIINSDELVWIFPNQTSFEEDNRGIFNPVKTELNGRNSYMNIGNAILILMKLREAIKKYDKKNIGIITPFNAQANLIKQFIITYPEYILGEKYVDEKTRIKNAYSILSSVKINTINKFQGQETELLIFDLTSNASFVFSDFKKLNVVLGRAKNQIIMIGMPPNFPIFSSLFEYSKTYGDIDYADHSLSFLTKSDELEEFEKFSKLIKTIRPNNFELEKELVKSLLIEYSKQFRNITQKDSENLIKEVIREYFSAEVINENNFDEVDMLISAKINEYNFKKNGGSLLNYM